MLCGQVACSKHLTASCYYTCYGGRTFLWRTDDKLPDYMVSSQSNFLVAKALIFSAIFVIKFIPSQSSDIKIQ